MASVVGGGVGTILVVLGVAAIWPEVLRLGSLHEAGREAEEYGHSIRVHLRHVAVSCWSSAAALWTIAHRASGT